MRQAVVGRLGFHRLNGLTESSKLQFSGARYNVQVKFVRMFMQSLALGVGALLAVRGEISVGAIIAASVLLSRALQPLEQIVGQWPTLTQSRRALATLEQLFVDTDASRAPRLMLPDPKGRLELIGVTVRDPRGEAFVLKNISLTLAPGEILGVVGPSGAGKSTLARVAAGALLPDLGEVRIDDASAADWDSERLARHIGYVPQGCGLMPGSVTDGFAALTPLDAGANAEGIVAMSGSRQAVQHHQGGIVTDIRVTEGQSVRKGDVILKISASEAVAIERALTSDYIAMVAQRARLLAERDGRGSVTQPTELAALPAEDQRQAAEALAGQRLLFNARLDTLQGERMVLGQRIAQHREQIGGVAHQIRSNREQQRLIGEEIDGLRSLLPKGYVSLNRLRGIERSAAELDGSHGAYRADIARVSEAIGETRLEVLTLDKRRLEEVASQLRELQMRLDEVTPKLTAVREQLARSTVRAPASGRVVGLKVFTVGGVVAAGDTLMEIVPQDRALVIEGKASPTDADDLVPGMETQVRFSALQERNLLILMGRLTKVSADSFEDERSGMRYFKIEAVVPPSELAKLELFRRGGGLSAGLPAEIMISLRKRIALEYLVEPMTQSLWHAGREN